MRLLRSTTRPLAWDHWMRLADVTAPGATTVGYEHFYLCLQAAAAGLGVGMASLLMVQDELKSGQLIAPFGFRRDGSRYCLLSPRPFDDSSKCKIFLEWITEQMADTIQWLEAS